MRPGTAARGLAACALVAATTSGSTARADGVQVVLTADSLLQEGRRLLAEGKGVEACLKLSSGHRLSPSASSALEVGDCFVKAGKTASARAAFDEARALGKQSSDEAEQRMKAIDDQQPKVILEAPGGVAPGTTIRIDGIPIDPAATGTPLPLEHGPHLVEVSRGASTWTARVEVEATGTRCACRCRGRATTAPSLRPRTRRRRPPTRRQEAPRRPWRSWPPPRARGFTGRATASRAWW